MYVNLVARISSSHATSTDSSMTEGTERREQSRHSRQAGKQMLTLPLLPKNAHPHNLLPFSKTYLAFSSYTDLPHPLPKDPECVCVMRWGIKKQRSNKIGPFFFLRKTRNEALCTSAAVAYLKGLARLLLCHQNKGDWGKTQTEPLCRCGSGY